MAKFSFKFFKTKSGHYVLYGVAALVLFYIAYRYISGVGGGTVINTQNSGPSDAQIQAEAAQNLASIQANAGVSATQIQANAATAQAVLAAQVASLQIQEQGNEAALAATVANNTITAQTQVALNNNATGLAATRLNDETLIAQMTLQANEFNEQLKTSLAGQILALESTVTKKSSTSVKNTLPILSASVSAFLLTAGGSIPDITLH